MSKTKEEKREYARIYRMGHREQIRRDARKYCSTHVEQRKTYRTEHAKEINAHNKAYRAANKDRIAAHKREYYSTHPGEEEIKRAYNKAYNATHPKDNYGYRLRSKFGMSKSEYNELLTAQGGVCAICKKKAWNSKRPCVDHDHDTGKVRGLLCHRCNLAIGQIDDNPQIARLMADYLSRAE